MKKLLFSLMAVLMVAGLGLMACNDGGDAANDSADSETKDMNGPEYTSAYICPMHCAGSGGSEAGKCPSCGMKYVANPDHEMHKNSGATQTDSHEGHDHEGDSHEGHDHGDAEVVDEHAGHDHD